MSEKTFKIKIINADSVLAETDAVSVTASNRTGRFDILSDHQPFLCLLQSGDVIIRKPGNGIQTVPISQGVLRIADNRAVILVNI